MHDRTYNGSDECSNGEKMLPQNRWLVLAIVSSALFLVVIDMTVLYTALPRLTHDLRLSNVPTTP